MLELTGCPQIHSEVLERGDGLCSSSDDRKPILTRTRSNWFSTRNLKKGSKFEHMQSYPQIQSA